MTSLALYIFSGLPGTGKTTLAQRLADERQGCYVRIDTIEQAMRELCSINVQAEGYQLAYRIAADNLKLGLSVVADSCNPVEITRREWMQVARQEGVRYVNIEVCCSDKAEHQRRIESRVSSVPGLKPPTWNDVLSREYESWNESRLEIDTAHCSADESFAYLLQKLGSW